MARTMIDKTGHEAKITLGALMADGFRLWTKYWLAITLILAAGCCCAVGMIYAGTHAATFVRQGIYRQVGRHELFYGMYRLIDFIFRNLGAAIILFFTQGFPQAVLSLLAMHNRPGQKISWMVLWRRLLPRLPSLVGLYFCAAVTVVAYFVLIQAAASGYWDMLAIMADFCLTYFFIVMVCFNFAPACLVIEGLAPFASMRRGIELSNRHRVKTWQAFFLFTMMSTATFFAGAPLFHVVFGDVVGVVVYGTIITQVFGYITATVAAFYARLRQSDTAREPADLIAVFE